MQIVDTVLSYTYLIDVGLKEGFVGKRRISTIGIVTPNNVPLSAERRRLPLAPKELVECFVIMEPQEIKQYSSRSL